VSVDYPPGKWSPLLVGHQWVSGTTLKVITNALANRRAIKTHFSDLHETLQSALNTTLASQEGATADAIRDAFHQGTDQAFQVAEKNEAYAKALQHAHNSVIALRHLLTDVAERGNQEINDAQKSSADVVTKLVKICEVIADRQREANQKAAGCADDIMDAGQNVFTAQGIGQSFRGLAHANGIDNVNKQPDVSAIENQVRGKLGLPPSNGDNSRAAPGAQAPGGNATPSPQAPGGNATPSAQAPGRNAVPGGAPPAQALGGGNAVPGAPAPGRNAVPGAPAPAQALGGGNAVSGAPAPGRNAVPGAPAPGRNAVPGGAASAMPGAGSPHLSAPEMPTSPMSGAPSTPTTGMPDGWAPASPASAVPQGFDIGTPASAPVSAGAPDLPSGPAQAMDDQALQAATTLPSAGAGAATDDMASTASHASATAAPASHAPPSPMAQEPVSPMMTGSAASPVSSASGGLPAYGADLRPVAASTPASQLSQPPPPPPSSTVSGSAPVTPAGSQVGVGQPAVASQPNPATAAGAQPGMGPQVVMATASGALAGAMSADATARARLQRLVAAVARQQPLLAWAVGDRADGTTVLVTDLASGWIPPDVDLPAAVTLLEPERRRGDLEMLLGAVDPAATYTPGHYLPDPDADEPVATSPWSRHAPDIEELSWQLSDATHWRDGLPRLAHTLAKAASRGTGVLESEADELNVELTKLADRVLDSYPDEVNATEVGNWQLLAAIEALVTDDWTAANYHLAWFLACNTAEVGGVAR
jgi:hypothetical protein